MKQDVSKRDAGASQLDAPRDARILIIEAPYYKAVSDHLMTGAQEVLSAAGVVSVTVGVPGALEIPQALGAAVAGGAFASRDAPRGADGFDGVIVIGCVIRGETSHYDIVCNSTNHWLMEIATRHTIPVGNAVLTVDTEAQALARAEGRSAGKGGDAARACLALIALKRHFESQTV